MWRCSEIVWQKHGKLLNNWRNSFRYHNLREKQNNKHIKIGWMHFLSLALFCGLFVRSQNRAGGQRRTWKSNLSPTPLNTPSCWTLSAIHVDSSTRWQMSYKSENFVPNKRRKNCNCLQKVKLKCIFQGRAILLEGSKTSQRQQELHSPGNISLFQPCCIVGLCKI